MESPECYIESSDSDFFILRFKHDLTVQQHDDITAMLQSQYPDKRFLVVGHEVAVLETDASKRWILSTRSKATPEQLHWLQDGLNSLTELGFGNFVVTEDLLLYEDPEQS